MATISIGRDELLAKLAEAKARADREDARAAKAHEKEERDALAKFRAELKAAMKLDYKAAKELRRNRHGGVQIQPPPCPTRHASRIELAIRQVQMDTRKGRFRLKDAHDWYRAATWLPESERPKASVCD